VPEPKKISPLALNQEDQAKKFEDISQAPDLEANDNISRIAFEPELIYQSDNEFPMPKFGKKPEPSQVNRAPTPNVNQMGNEIGNRPRENSQNPMNLTRIVDEREEHQGLIMTESALVGSH
jgi:hypothetical protein